MIDLSPDSNSLMKTFSIKKASLNKKMNKFITTTPKRMKGRTNIPPPLSLDPLTPPATVKTTKRTYNALESPNNFDIHSFVTSTSALHNTSTVFNEFEELDFKDIDDISPNLQIKNIQSKVNKYKSFLNNNCCFCEEPLINKLNGEKIIELSCNHQSHFDCYFLLLNKENINELPECCTCGETTKPIDENIIEELHSKTLVDTDDFEALQQPSIIEQKVSTPFTPQDRIINNCNSAGFQSPKIKSLLSSVTTASTTTFSSTTPQPRFCIEDLLKPTINIIPEFNKISVCNDEEQIEFGNVLNLFTNKLEEEETDKDLKEEYRLKQEIFDKIIRNFTKNINDLKGINFQKFSKLCLFDFIEISLDGYNWENVQSFIFHDVLLLLNEEGDCIIGTILIQEHFTKINKLDEDTLMLYFNTTTLPELQIRSQNTILISKWLDFFQNKVSNDFEIPLIQLTTNAWSLILDESDNDDYFIDIPEEIIKFNELTSKGLDLPFQIMKDVLPRPTPLPLNLIMTISLINNTDISNSEYLEQIQLLIHKTLSGMSSIDRFGLVLIGRDGNRQRGSKGTFFGMVSPSWIGWNEIINDLEIFQSSELYMIDEFNIGLRTVGRLLSTISGLNEVESIKKLIAIGCNVDDEDVGISINKKYLNKVVNEFGFSLHQILISKKYDDCYIKMINDLMKIDDNHQYEFKRFNSIELLNKEMDNLVLKWKKVTIPKLSIELEAIEDYISMTYQDITKSRLKLNISDLDPGYYKNLKISIDLDLIFLQKTYKYPINQFIELPIFKYKLKYLNQMIENTFYIKLQITESNPNNDLKTPIDGLFPFECEEAQFIDIPLLPPLSSFRDSIYVKKEIETMIVTKLDDKSCTIDELITIIFGLSKGCSTNYINFFKDSNFSLNFKNFSNYIEYLIHELNILKKIQVEDDYESMKIDFINKLKME